MDGPHHSKQRKGSNMDEAELQLFVKQQLEVIKTKMPSTYAEIKERGERVTGKVFDPANDLVRAEGSVVYQLVRRGIRGEPNCFYAVERGHVVGTPFNIEDVARDIAWGMVSLGCAHVCILPVFKRGTQHGAH